MSEDKNRGRRVEILCTDDPLLKAGDRGTYLSKNSDYYATVQYWVKWDCGVTLALVKRDKWKFIT